MPRTHRNICCLCWHSICQSKIRTFPMAQNAQALVQRFLIGLLNTEGRRLISATLRQREGGSSIYPVGEAPLKDIVTDYASLTGSSKWLLASIMLLMFRPVLHNAASLVSSGLRPTITN